MKQKFSFEVTGKRKVNPDVEIPNECPICHFKVSISGPVTYNYRLVEQELQVVFRCPDEACKSLFIAYYDFDEGPDEIKFKQFRPNVPLKEPLSENISNMSPQFILVYNEALEAMELGLTQIAGPGFRKAFEFLIKDYAKSVTKDTKHEKIEKTFSGNVVEERISDPRIQALAKRALWLGNDETHYLKKWKDHNLQDLISLVKLTLYWIEMEKLSENYTSDMT